MKYRNDNKACTSKTSSRSERAKRALCCGFAAAIMLAACGDGTEAKAEKQTFLFPQISSSAAAEKQEGEQADKVTYSFRICELLDKIFQKK